MIPRIPLFRFATALAWFAVIALGLVSLVREYTASRIADNEQAALLQNLETLVPADRFDNNPATDAITVIAPILGDTQPVTVYRTRKSGDPVAAVLATTAPDGYGGPIRLLTAIDSNGAVLGARALSHHETPGLGDFIEAGKSNWIFEFEGRSLANTDESAWRVKRDGGAFDQFAGATVTPRAVVKAVYRALVFFQRNRGRLFNEAPGATLRFAEVGGDATIYRNRE